MPMTTIFVCGPGGAGKSMLARLLARDVLRRPPHYVRLCPIDLDGLPSRGEPDVTTAEGVASAQCVGYTPERVFEVLPDVLTKIRRQQKIVTAIIEADSDPCLRHAHPYDHRIFAMTAPDDLHRVFRRPAEASAAMKQVMEDTAAFASEIFGLFDDASMDDDEGVRHRRGVRTPHGIEEQIEVSEHHVRRFALSPLGAEIASRIQLQPEYHAMIESDVVVLNGAAGPRSPTLEACARRIETLLGRIREHGCRESTLFCCDPSDASDARRRDLLERLRTMLIA